MRSMTKPTSFISWSCCAIAAFTSTGSIIITSRSDVGAGDFETVVDPADGDAACPFLTGADAATTSLFLVAVFVAVAAVPLPRR